MKERERERRMKRMDRREGNWKSRAIL